MTNTRQHAGGASAGTAKPWWAMSHYDEESGVGRFAFMDQGVGICRSVKLKATTTALRAVGLMGSDDILRAVFEGTIGSRTGLSHRGLGLPTMRRDVQLGEIRRLYVLCNDVIGDIGNDDYRKLRTYFHGTLIVFELGRTMERNDENAQHRA